VGKWEGILEVPKWHLCHHSLQKNDRYNNNDVNLTLWGEVLYTYIGILGALDVLGTEKLAQFSTRSR
jgi:hypothetical protein